MLGASLAESLSSFAGMEFNKLQLIGEQFHTTKMTMIYWEKKEARAETNSHHATFLYKKIMYFLLCTMKLKNLMHWKWETKTLNAKRGRYFGWQIWLYPNHFLKENHQKWLLLSFWSYTKDLIGMEACKLSIQLFGESFTNKTFIIGWKTFWTGFKIQD